MRADTNHQQIADAHGRADDIGVAVGRRIEAARINSDLRGRAHGFLAVGQSQQPGVGGAAGHRPGVVVLEDAAGDEDEREVLVGGITGRLIWEGGEVAAAAGAVEGRVVEGR